MMTVVPTIDVEGVHGTRPFAQFVRGELSGTNFGVLKQAQIFRTHGISATFFVDCYEYTLWGEGPLEEICNRLLDHGQDVQLHTHPSWRDDIHDFRWLRDLKRTRSFFPQHLDLMAKLDYSQQVEVLERGIELLVKWTGRRPVAHRSGGYSINSDTVKALVATGIPLDSSMHPNHPNSKIAWGVNRIVERDGLIELPITLLQNSLGHGLPGRKQQNWCSKTLNTDLDCCSVADFIGFVDHGQQEGIRIMNLFMHSYSLLKFDPYFRHIRPSVTQVEKLTTLLARLMTRDDIQFMSCQQILDAYRNQPDAFDSPESIPCIRDNGKILRMACAKVSNSVIDGTVKTLDRFINRAAA